MGMGPTWRERLKQVIDDPSHLALTLIIGAVVGSTIVLFMVCTDRMHQLFFGPATPVWLRPLVPALAALLTGYAIQRFFPDARGSGIPQTKAALVAGGGFISLRTALGKFLCCSFSLGSGIALGREGPSVQIGAGIASVVARKSGLTKEDVQSLVPVGAAAALAAAFNTPMAGVLFTLEELLGDLNARLLGSVVIGAAASWMVLHLFLGDSPLFHVPAYTLVHPSEFLFYAVLGVLGGCVSAAFSFILLRLRTYYRRLPKWSGVFQPATGGLSAGLLALWSAEVLGAGYGAVELALHGRISGTDMLILLVLKLLATTLCYSSGNAGGIFGPSLFLGAMLGGSAGSLVHAWFPATTGPAGAYALVGMGTTFAGIIRSPITSVVMIFELTRDYNIIVPLMISNMVSYVVARAIIRTPIYEALAIQDGVHLPPSKGHRGEPEHLVGDAMRSPAVLLSPDTAASTARSLVPEGDCLIGEGNRLLTILRGWDLDEALRKGQGERAVSAIVHDNESAEVPFLFPDQSADLVLHYLGRANLDVLPVVDRRDTSRVLGEVTLDDVLSLYHGGRHPKQD
jgi:chloride channel protein, CIC family